LNGELSNKQKFNREETIKNKITSYIRINLNQYSNTRLFLNIPNFSLKVTLFKVIREWRKRYELVNIFNEGPENGLQNWSKNCQNILLNLILLTYTLELFNIVSLMIEYDKERRIKIGLNDCKWMGMCWIWSECVFDFELMKCDAMKLAGKGIRLYLRMFVKLVYIMNELL